ncbi:hypothetical protein ACIBAH_00370 [Streptomyces sp. NPDC051445]|uniref:hypothetical protein n=1 Tax=unclassified Streptomyces TaxID=2593676 RepID=UPI0034528F4D
MPRLMDWSVFAMGCLLVLLGFGARRWERAAIRNGARPRRGTRFVSTWLPLLLGLGLIVTKGSELVGAPFAVVMIADSLNVVLAVTAAVIMVGQAAHVRARGGSRGPDRPA